MKYFISAGEASGDLHASQLIKALKENDTEASFIFLGGEKSAEATSSKPLIDISEMSYMGFGEVIRHLPGILKNLSKAKKAIDEWRPDALILVDYPSFNLKLARHAHTQGIKVFWYISPKVWVWKEGRVKPMKKYIDRLYCILPFEPEYYKKRHNWDVVYAGNPSVEEVLNFSNNQRISLFEQLNINREKPVLALLPGSRYKEIVTNLPIMAEVVPGLPDWQPVIAGMGNYSEDLYKSFAPNIPVIMNNTYNLLKESQGALVTSGTAVLETALLGIPQVMMYRHSGSRLQYKLFRGLLKVPYFSLPNLINGKETVPELVMHFCTPANVLSRLREILPQGSKHYEQKKDYAEMLRRLGKNVPSVMVAEDIVNILKSRV